MNYFESPLAVDSFELVPKDFTGIAKCANSQGLYQIFWYKNGKLHRLDGPACTYFTFAPDYYIEGANYSKERFYAHPVVKIRINLTLWGEALK